MTTERGKKDEKSAVFLWKIVVGEKPGRLGPRAVMTHNE